MNQKGFVNIVLVVVIVILVSAVGYFVFSQKPNSDTIIQSPSLPDITTLPEIQYEDLSKFGSKVSLACISISDTNNREKEFVINTEAEYQDLINYKSSFSPSCTNFVLPSIDFSQKTLLGKYASGGGCSIDFTKKVHKDDSNKKVVYVIDVIEQGMCEKLGFSNNWILIPKIPFNYTVEFQVK